MNGFSPAVIIPTYREYDNLSELTEKLWRACPQATLLIVDDASQDGTPEWVKKHSAFGDKLFLIERDGKKGLGTAYLEGFKWALQRPYDTIIQMDADLSHDPAEIPELCKKIEAGADLVLTSRYLNGVRVLNWPLGRLMLSLGAARYVKLFTGMPFTDPTSGFKCWKKSLLEKLNFAKIHSNGYSFQIEMSYLAWRLKVIIVEVPIVFEGRHAGMSKMSGHIAREAFFEVLRLSLGRFSR